jgi:hypothetical protein
VDRLAPPAAGEGYQIAMEATAPAFAETWLCQISEFPGDGVNYVHRVESLQSDVMHHMDVMATAFAEIDLPPGTYDCNDIYRDYPNLMEDGLIIYGAQAASQQINLPDGVAAAVPAGLQIMQEIHYVNTSPNDMPVFSQVNAYLMPEADVKETLWGTVVRDTHLSLPPNAEHSEWTRCVMGQDVRLLFLASHTHQLASSVEVRLFDGEKAGEAIYENTDWASPQLKDFTVEERHIAKGTGFEFQCNFNNTTGEQVEWGFQASDEMCQIALVFTPGSGDLECEVVESSDGFLE